MNYLIHNPRCSKSRGALELLTKHSVDFKVIDYTKNELSLEMIKKLPSLLGLSYLEMMRTKDDLFKELSTKIHFDQMAPEKISEIIFEYPMLLERPIFIKGKKALIARPPEHLLELL